MTAPLGPDIVDESAPRYLDAPKPLTGTITSNAEVEAVVTQAQDIDGISDTDSSTALVPPTRQTEISWSRSETARTRSSERARAAFRSFTYETPPPPRSWPSTMARPGSTTTSMTTQLRCASGCRTLRASLARRRRSATVSPERAEREVGRQIVYYGTQLRGSSNGKARRDLGFAPVYPDWRDGFRASLASERDLPLLAADDRFA